MTDNPRLQLALELFWQLKKQDKIFDKLQAAMHRVKGDMDDIKTVLQGHAKWKTGTVLTTSDSKLYVVTKVQVKQPDPDDMFPIFVYTVGIVDRLAFDATLKHTVNVHYGIAWKTEGHLYPRAMAQDKYDMSKWQEAYRPATMTEIVRAKDMLAASRKSKSKKAEVTQCNIGQTE